MCPGLLLYTRLGLDRVHGFPKKTCDGGDGQAGTQTTGIGYPSPPKDFLP
jgi:hypothetical protein